MYEQRLLKRDLGRLDVALWVVPAVCGTAQTNVFANKIVIRSGRSGVYVRDIQLHAILPW